MASIQHETTFRSRLENLDRDYVSKTRRNLVGPPHWPFLQSVSCAQTPELRQVRTRSTLTRLRRPRNISEFSANIREPSRFHFANLVWLVRKYPQRDSEKREAKTFQGCVS